jgi:hypothetical protein
MRMREIPHLSSSSSVHRYYLHLIYAINISGLSEQQIHLSAGENELQE